MQVKRLNIPSYIEDPNYRYQMPACVLKIEGKGNGIKTNIVNMVDVAKALRVPTEYPLKFLGHELGSQTIFKEKGHDVTSIINGAFTEDEIRKSMDKFIEKYALCPKCKYPELVLRVKKGVACGKCNACGGRFDVDNVHKFAAFIIKNPPKDKSEIIKEKKPKKDGGEEEVKKKSSKKKKEEAKEEDEDDGEGAKKTEQGPDVPLDQLASKIAEVRQAYLKLNLDTFKGKQAEAQELVDLVNTFKLRRPNLNSFVLFQGVFDVNIAKQITKNSALLKAAQKDFDVPDEELDLLLNLEHTLYVANKDQNYDKYIPTILHTLYNEDLLSEDFLVDWSENKLLMNMKGDSRYNIDNDKKFREAAKDMIEWLKNADDE